MSYPRKFGLFHHVRHVRQGLVMARMSRSTNGHAFMGKDGCEVWLAMA
jgi:hypothetical protein